MKGQVTGPIRLAEAARHYPGKWVAIKDGEVVGVRETPDQLVDELFRREIQGAYIVRMPSELDHELVGLG